ncbi:MAG TPA: EAL domain-containing protein [Polyangiaceae bacterium]|nr:EAL domain-containing protein [Polyangiaceae bacterium]
MTKGDDWSALVVDDEPNARTALARTVRSLGGRPVVAATAEEALALSQQEVFRVVITDVLMPGMGGLAMLQRLSPLQPQARFIVVTGAGPIEPDALPSGHRVRVFTKPWNTEQLAAAILDRTEGSNRPPPQAAPGVAMRVLLVQPDASEAQLFCAALKLAYVDVFSVKRVGSLDEVRSAVDAEHFDVVVLDQRDSSPVLHAIAKLQSDAPDLGLVVLAANDDSDLALRSVRAGAQDYLVKGRVGGTTIGCALRYASERKRSELRIAHMAFHDQLTGLANRTLFRQRVAQAIARYRRTGGKFAILFLDLDKFKDVNDAIGHDGGDVLLSNIAERLRGVTRETDTVARLGGDEFALLAEPITSADDVDRLARRVRAVIGEPVHVGGHKFTPSASIGASIFPDSGDDGDALIGAADEAMYRVKTCGRDGFLLHGAHAQEVVAKRLQTELALRRALIERRLAVYYQPQVAADLRVIGAEALLRWRQDDGTVVAAGEFVSVLEDCGLISETDLWVVNSVLDQLSRFRQEGVELERVAINLSVQQLTRTGVVESLGSAILKHGLAPSDVEVEVCAEQLTEHREALSETLSEFNRAGIRLALSNFGKAHTSLTDLLDSPISKVKLDGELVRDAVRDRKRRAFLGGIVQLGHRIGLDVMAEGVESEAELELLRSEGCGTFQGFFTGRPVAPTELRSQLPCARAPRSGLREPLARRALHKP